MIDLVTMQQWLQNGNGLILAGGTIAVIAFIMLISALMTIGEKIRRRRQISIKKNQKMHLGRSVIQNLIIIIILLTGCLIALLGMSLRMYQTFTKQQLIGTVACLDWQPNQQTMIIKFSPTDQQQVTKQSYSLKGDSWEINARILKWHPKVNLLGIHTGYRLHQIKGIYNQVEDVATKSHTAYQLYGGQDWLWQILTSSQWQLPMVEAVYGNAVSRPARAGERYDIYVTTSGLMAKRHQVQEPTSDQPNQPDED